MGAGPDRSRPAEATCHDLRHFFASALIRAGLSVKVVSDRLGHANAAQTLGVYAHLWPDDDDRSREAIDAAFRRDVPPPCAQAGRRDLCSLRSKHVHRPPRLFGVVLTKGGGVVDQSGRHGV
ncbi:tyrosine-type recombinase/integrase [Micromonospora sp. RTP1Z1]|uniref:tyrosine-type recombinase/integrase n=1 Tax=Micromonospora sp. RTP1Z1 TaxID=2994043 RepID=UPI0029C6F4C9|nr:tyrosine-type recombinase/integrase [Micromonospora sp. RTP1Z1]